MALGGKIIHEELTGQILGNAAAAEEVETTDRHG
jgi:hypothetical protein